MGSHAMPVGIPQSPNGDSPFDRGVSLSPLRGFGGTPEFQNGGRLGGVKNGQ